MHWFRPQLEALIRLAAPAVLSQLAQMGLGFIDVLMAGRAGELTLAAVSVGSNLFIPVIVFVLGIFLSINPLTAEAAAQRDYTRLAGYLKTGLLLALLLSIPTWWLLRHFDGVLSLLAIDPRLHRGANEYLLAVSWSALPLMGFLALRFFNEGLFATRIIMLISLSALPVNFVFNYYFAFLLHMGPRGFGLATAIAYGYLFIVLALYTFRHRGYHRIHAKIHLARLRPHFVLRIVKLGLPIALGLGMEVSLFAGIGLLIAQYGNDIVAGHQIALNIASMTFMVPMGISIATTARVGYFYGKNDILTARRVALLAVALSTLCMLIFATVMWLFADRLVALYSDQPTILRVAASLLLFAALFQLFDGVQVTLSGALRGLQDTTVPMLISLLAYWFIGFGTGLYFSQNYHARGFWMGLVAGLASAAFLLVFRFRHVIRARELQ